MTNKQRSEQYIRAIALIEKENAGISSAVSPEALFQILKTSGRMNEIYHKDRPFGKDGIAKRLALHETTKGLQNRGSKSFNLSGITAEAILQIIERPISPQQDKLTKIFKGDEEKWREYYKIRMRKYQPALFK